MILSACKSLSTTLKYIVSIFFSCLFVSHLFPPILTTYYFENCCILFQQTDRKLCVYCCSVMQEYTYSIITFLLTFIKKNIFPHIIWNMTFNSGLCKMSSKNLWNVCSSCQNQEFIWSERELYLPMHLPFISLYWSWAHCSVNAPTTRNKLLQAWMSEEVKLRLPLDSCRALWVFSVGCDL